MSGAAGSGHPGFPHGKPGLGAGQPPEVPSARELLFARLLEFGLGLVLPVVLLWLIGEGFLERSARREEAFVASRFDANSNALEFHLSERNILRKWFDDLTQVLESSAFSEPSGTAAALPLPPAFLDVQAGVLDRSGRLWVPPGVKLGARYVVEKLLNDLKSQKSEERSFRLYKALLGKGMRPIVGISNRPGKTLSFPNEPDGRSLVIWKRGPARSAALAFLNHPVPIEDRLDHACRLLASDATWIISAGGPLEERGNVSSGRIAADSGATQAMGVVGRNPEGLELPPAGGTGEKRCGDWKVRWERRCGKLNVFQALPTGARGNQVALDVLRVSCGLAFLVIGVVWFSSGWFPFSHSGVSTRLLFLFLTAILIPGAFLLQLGVSFFQDRQEALTVEIHAADVARLRSIDASFQEWRENLPGYYESIWKRPQLLEGRKDAVGKIAEGLRKRGLGLELDIRSDNNESLFTTLSDRMFQRLTGHLCSIGRHRLLGAPLWEPESPVDQIVRDALLSPNFGLSLLIDRPGEIIPFELKWGEGLWYWLVRNAGPTTPTSFFIILNPVVLMYESFLRENLPKGVFAYRPEETDWAPRHPEILPPGGVLVEAMARMRPTMARQGGGDGEFLISCCPSAALKGVCFVTASPFQPVLEAGRRLKLLFGLAGILLLSIAAAVALFLSRTLLRPIKNLADGIEALDHRSFGFRIPATGGDELGQVGKAFNEMMEELKDLDMAREVQRYILPRELPTIPGYELAFRCLSLAQVGGDYGDILVGPDGRTFLIIADVTGHGVSAALLTTMVKTIVLLFWKENRPLAEIVSTLNRLIFRLLKRKKLLTLAAAILDPRTHEIEYVTAGHPFPVFVTPAGEIKEIGHSQKPLGINPDLTWKTGTASFGPGDTLVIYTDGLLESSNFENVVFGFEHFYGILKARKTSKPVEIIENLLHDRITFAMGKPLDDDLTLLLVRRNV